MKKIIVYTGSFNPVTKAHINTINELKKIDGVYRIHVVPVGDSYNKKNLEKSKHRYNMLKFLEDDIVYINNVEIKAVNQLKTFETLSEISIENPDCELYLVMGSDNLLYFDKWYKSEILLDKFNLLVVKRNDFKETKEIINENELLKKYKNKINGIEINQNYISSTLVRDAISKGDYKDILSLIELITLNYIKDNNLYKKKS